MLELAAAIEASGLAGFLRASRWTYPAVNTAHVLGIALLVGAIIPMDLRLIGMWRRDVALPTVLRLLRPVAVAGALIAIASGVLLFMVQAKEYVSVTLFYLKMALVLFGLLHALSWRGGLAAAPRLRQRTAGAISLAVWLTVLTCGRMIGYL